MLKFRATLDLSIIHLNQFLLRFDFIWFYFWCL